MRSASSRRFRQWCAPRSPQQLELKLLEEPSDEENRDYSKEVADLYKDLHVLGDIWLKINDARQEFFRLLLCMAQLHRFWWRSEGSSRLPPYESLSLRSSSHAPQIVWSYDVDGLRVDNVPGVSFRSAEAILPLATVLYLTSNGVHVRHIKDIFFLLVLYQHGGVCLDLYFLGLLQRSLEGRPVVFGVECVKTEPAWRCRSDRFMLDGRLTLDWWAVPKGIRIYFRTWASDLLSGLFPAGFLGAARRAQ
jgi:hypothetical protein